MGIIAWIILGLAAGPVVKQLVPGKDTRGPVIIGGLLGDFVATQLGRPQVTPSARPPFQSSTSLSAPRPSRRQDGA